MHLHSNKTLFTNTEILLHEFHILSLCVLFLFHLVINLDSWPTQQTTAQSGLAAVLYQPLAQTAQAPESSRPQSVLQPFCCLPGEMSVVFIHGRLALPPLRHKQL